MSPKLGDILSTLPQGERCALQGHVQSRTPLSPRQHPDRWLRAGLGARQPWRSPSGAPAVATDVLAGGARLLTALENQGYAFAKVDPPVAHEDPDQHVLNLIFRVATGPRVQIGEIRFEGLKRVHERLVRRRLLLHTGEPYSAHRGRAGAQGLADTRRLCRRQRAARGCAGYVGTRAGHVSDERAATACRQPECRVLERPRRQRRRDLERSQRARQRRSSSICPQR